VKNQAKGRKSFVEIKSFGFKYAANPSADLQIDLRRKIHNPQSHLPVGAVGTELEVKRAVLGNSANKKVFEQALGRVRKLVRMRDSTTISFGCTSGIHRSVVFAEELAVRLLREGYEVKVTHVHLKK
jgi:UPF0042 nucleotide-binding protein